MSQGRERIARKAKPGSGADPPDRDRLARLDRHAAEKGLALQRSKGWFYVILLADRNPAGGDDEIGPFGEIAELPDQSRAAIGPECGGDKLDICAPQRRLEHRTVHIRYLRSFAQ